MIGLNQTGRNGKYPTAEKTPLGGNGLQVGLMMGEDPKVLERAAQRLNGGSVTQGGRPKVVEV